MLTTQEEILEPNKTSWRVCIWKLISSQKPFSFLIKFTLTRHSCGTWLLFPKLKLETSQALLFSLWLTIWREISETFSGQLLQYFELVKVHLIFFNSFYHVCIFFSKSPSKYCHMGSDLLNKTACRYNISNCVLAMSEFRDGSSRPWQIIRR